MNSQWLVKTLLLGLLASPASAQKGTKQYVLPGFVQINDSVFISKTEIDIKEYGRYLMVWHRMSGDPGFMERAIPASHHLGWSWWIPSEKTVYEFGSQYQVIDRDRIVSSARDDTTVSYAGWISGYPVVNITREQASWYCDFRTKDYQFFFSQLNKRKRDQFPQHVVFRLPTSAEWTYAASAGLDTLKFKYGQEIADEKYPEPVSTDTYAKDSTGQLHPIIVSEGPVNKFQLLNMCGNVAELVSDSDYAYGGSFLDSKTSCTINSRQLCKEPKSNVGFRIVAVIQQSPNMPISLR